MNITDRKDLPWPWTSTDVLLLQATDTFGNAREIAREVMRRMKPGVSLVSGPITTGGRGSREENTRVFRESINRLQLAGVNVFNQVPAESEDTMGRLADAWMKRNRGYSYPMGILWDFYSGLIADRHVEGMIFIPGWYESTGSRWEHEHCVRLNKKIVYLNDDWAKSFVVAA